MASYIIENNKQYSYISESISYWNKNIKKCRTRKKTVGTLDRATGFIDFRKDFIKSYNYKTIKIQNQIIDILNPVIDVSKLSFRNNNIYKNTKNGSKDKIETNKIDDNLDNKRYLAIELLNTTKIFGIYYLFFTLSNNNKFYDILLKVFNVKTDFIFSLISYIVSEHKPFMYSNYWSSDNYFYSGTNLTSQKVSDLFDKITAQERNLFYKEWIKVIREKEFLVLDITSISSYSKKLDESEFGHNRDKDKLPQINLYLLFGEESYLPMYQNLFNGSLNDVKTLSETIMEFFGIIGDYNFTLVMDKGFYSDNNVNFMLSKKEIEFLISVPFTCQYATDLVNIENNINNFDNYIHTSKEDDICRGKTRFILWNNGFIKFLSDDEVDIYNEDNILKAYIYYNPISALKAEQKFFKILNEAKEKLLKKSKDKKYIEYSKYFNIIIDSKTKKVVSITNKIAVIEEHLKTNGYFILLSNSLIKNSNNDESNNQYKIYRNQQDAYNIYRRKDVVEKSFNNYKNHLGLDRFHVHGSKRMINKSFILFLAQILYTLIYKKMIDNKLFESLTFEEMLLEMKKIKKITIDNVDYIKPLTKRQKTILESFNVPIPITL